MLWSLRSCFVQQHTSRQLKVSFFCIDTYHFTVTSDWLVSNQNNDNLYILKRDKCIIMGKARWSEVFDLVWSCLIMLRSLGSSFMRRGFAWNMSHRCSDAPDQYKIHFSINTKRLVDSRAIGCFWGGAWHWRYFPWLRTELQSNAGLPAGSVRKGCICLVCLSVNDPIPAYSKAVLWLACFWKNMNERHGSDIKHLF